VWEYGAELVELLAPLPSERILDLGCGPGHLTAESRVIVVGVDSAPSMVAQARRHYPSLKFEIADARNLPYHEEFDAVFSNAALHWVRPPEDAIDGIWRALRPGGRFVAELDGKGNIASILEAIKSALGQVQVHMQLTGRPDFYFPGSGEYASLLKENGFSVTLATLFGRPTGLDNGPRGLRLWLEMFATGFLAGLDADPRVEVIELVERRLRPRLYSDGQGTVEYKRLRVVARKE